MGERYSSALAEVGMIGRMTLAGLVEAVGAAVVAAVGSDVDQNDLVVGDSLAAMSMAAVVTGSRRTPTMVLSVMSRNLRSTLSICCYLGTMSTYGW